MNNPFEHNKENLPSGFYFDSKKKCIVFHFVGQEDDDMFSYSKTYNRHYKPTNMPPFMVITTPQDSNPVDLVDLRLEQLTDRNQVVNDFKWLNSNSQLYKSFIDYLLNEEKYLLLDLFKTFVESKTQAQ